MRAGALVLAVPAIGAAGAGLAPPGVKALHRLKALSVEDDFRARAVNGVGATMITLHGKKPLTH